MIVTLTPNPSIDRAYDLDHLLVGEVNRAAAVHVDAGGKGINVSRALHAASIPTRAVLPVGGPDGELLLALLAQLRVPTVPVPVEGATRSNITLVAGDTTKVNAPGPNLDDAARDRLLRAVADAVAPGDVVVAAGSLPAGVAPDLYVRLGGLVRERGAGLVLDTSGPALQQAVAAGGLALIKPNDEELAELVGRELPTVGDVVTAARELVATGTDRVLVSLGAHGALLVSADGSWWAGGPALVAASTVGAGDTTLAGYLAACTSGHGADSRTDLAADPAHALRTAVAWGRAAVQLPGTAVPTPDLVRADEVRILTTPDPTTPIKEM
ncbi:1-phosphofructokinase [Miniimonas arenae]|uniref:1-phosphofructokinase n=1 Tax=Miniimonas arenae TaxID=676201 RepID=A0A5C5BEL8_9MICO|nr:1-phosphofructokinase [Miniimonas arenae]TNU74984.1 1-phosphofructokinase [Miniimonas arenae]